MARMSLDTAIRLSAEVKGGGNITKVQRSLQDLAKGSQVTAREMQTLRAATFQYSRANDSTIAGIRNSISAFRGLQEQAKIGSREFQRYGSEIQKLEGKLKGIDGTAEKAGRSMGQNLAAGLAAGLAAAGIGQAIRGSLESVVAGEESQRRLRSLSQGLDDYSRVQATATAAAQKFGVAQTQANQEFAQIYARLRPVGLTLEEISTVYNGFNTAAKLSGTTSAEASAAFLQLSQALGTGVLRGEELNSVFEQTPAVVQGIAQVMGVPIGQIRDLAKEGKITGDIVLEALKRIERDGAPKLAEAMKGPAQQFKNLQIAGQDLQIQLGQALLPTALALANAALALAQGFNSLPGPVKNTAIAVGIAATATLGLVAAIAALKAGLAVIGVTGVVTALKGLTVAAFAAKVQMLALNAVALINPWVALAAGIGAATYALATYRSESEKIGGKAATGDAAAMSAAQQRITAKQQEISALEGQRPGPRSSRGGDLARARVELAQLQRDVQTGQRAAGGGVVPAAPVLPGNAMGTPIGATVGGGGGKSGGGAKQSAEDRIAAKPFGREIIAAAKANGVDPALFAALVAQESGFNQRAVSRSGAIGLSQLMPGTARELGVNPRDPMQNLMGGAKYLRQQLDRFGLEGGLRAYNQGPGAQQRTPGGNSRESREYPGRVLARYEQFAGGGEGIADLNAEGLKAQADAAEKMREQLKAAESINVALKDRLALAQTTEPVARQMLEYDIKQNELVREYEQRKNAAAGSDELILINANLIIEQRIEQIEHEEKLNSLLAERAVLMANVAAQAAMPTVYNELETQDAALQAVLDKYPAIGAAADAASTLATSGISEMIAGTKSAKEVFVDFLGSIADALMDTAKQMIAQYIAIGIAKMFAGMGGSVSTDAGGWVTSFATPQAGVGTGFNFDVGAMTGGTPWSFAGGGYTGNAPRAGGIDGQGGFPAILHPRETVIDHTKAISRQGAATTAIAPVSVTVNVDASGNSQVSGDQNQGAQLGRVIAGAVQQELIRQKRPGGLLAS
jgi:tape measure domain-containing protein